MPESKPPTGSPQQWLARARADLALAGVSLPPGALYEDLCFHLQQSVEKAVKAVYQTHGWTFRYTHDLKELLAGLQRKGLSLPPQIEDAASLSVYASEARYPGHGEPVSKQEYRQAFAISERVVRWAEALIEGKAE